MRHLSMLGQAAAQATPKSSDGGGGSGNSASSSTVGGTVGSSISGGGRGIATDAERAQLESLGIDEAGLEALNALPESEISEMATAFGLTRIPTRMRASIPEEVSSSDGGGGVDSTEINGARMDRRTANDARMDRRTVPADNTCLFTSIAYLLQGKSLIGGPEIRALVASAIESDPATYSAAVLGKPAAEYCAWLRLPTSWGGAIELAVMSQLYSTEIVALNVQTAQPITFGEGAGCVKSLRLCSLIFADATPPPLAWTSLHKRLLRWRRDLQRVVHVHDVGL
jgi:hypothetical protein